VRALGSSLRGRPDPNARKVLRALANDVNVRVSLGAIAGLAAANDPADAPMLRTIVEQGAADRRRAAALALGDMHDLGSVKALVAAMAARDDRLAGDAAWALGEILVAHPLAKEANAADLTQRWLHLAKVGGWSGAVNATASLARVLWVLPPAARGELLAGPRRAALHALAFHKSRLVRINAALALSSLPGDDAAAKALAMLARDDASPHVRAAGLLGLGRIGGPRAAPAIKAALDGDTEPTVRAAANAARTPLGAPIPRDEWRTYYIVDPGADDAPVRQEPYFVHTPDGLVWASYTDARGELTSEHVPAGEATVAPASREADY